MADIKTITQELWSGSNDSDYITISGSLSHAESYINNPEIPQTNGDDMFFYVL